MRRILIIGPAHPLRGGGMTTFNHRLAQQLTAEGHDCAIVSFSLQYPSFLFPGKSQYSTEPPPPGVVIHTLINSINPVNWLRVGSVLSRWKPDVVLVRFWLPFMGPALGTILRIVKRNRITKIICIADNVIPHEKRPGDKPFTRFFLKACDAFVVMSRRVEADLQTFEAAKPVRRVSHPLYDNFGEKVSKATARERLRLQPGSRVLLFFGFVRTYKGLDLLLKAMADDRVKLLGITLLVAGEFYEDETPYTFLIKEGNIDRHVVLRNHFVADADVRFYFSAADGVVQPYRHATQSGVTPLAYHFEVPMIVTNVGGLPEMVSHGKSGLVAEPNPSSIADAIVRYFNEGAERFREGVLEEKEKHSWSAFTRTVLQLTDEL